MDILDQKILILKSKLKLIKYFILVFLKISFSNAQSEILNSIDSAILFQGNETTAYRDPAVLYYNDQFYLFFTLVKTENKYIYSFIAHSRSKDLKKWSPIKILTPKDQNLNFSSPGNISRINGKWVMCLQTYPRPGYRSDEKIRYGSKESRIYLMQSTDLENWSNPELLKVKGPAVNQEDMGRMIDPFIIEDKEEKGKWWCFYKQNGVSISYTFDFQEWTFYGYTESGENVCIMEREDDYIMFHSPSNGIGMKRSLDLMNWEDFGEIITLGQKEWNWAKGRVTAGTVIDLRSVNRLGKYIMFFHGSGPRTENEGDFDKNSSIGLAWTENLSNWDWPGKK